MRPPGIHGGADYDEVADERGPLYTTWSDVFTNTWNNPDGGPLSDWYSTFVNGEGVLEDTPGLWYMNSGGNNTPFTYRDSRVWHTVMYLGNVIYSLAQAVDAGHTGCIASWNLITQIGNNWWFDLNEELSYSYPQKVYIPRSL